MNKRIPTLIGILFLIFSIWVLLTSNKSVRSVTERLEHLGYDIQLRSLIYSGKPHLSGSVVIVDIDEKSLQAEGRWPWPRSRVADLVNKLNEDGAAVIALDIFFPEREVGVDERLLTILRQHNVVSPITAELTQYSHLFDEDEILAKSLARSSSVLAFSFLLQSEKANQLPPPLLVLLPEQIPQANIFSAPGYASNIPILQNAAKASGFINIFPDDDGIVRRVPLLARYGEKVYAELALQAYLTFLGQTVELYVPEYHADRLLEGVKIKVGGHLIPTDERGLALIPFIGRSYSFPYYSAVDILKDKIPKQAILGKIVFVGTSATGLADLHPTAIQNPFPGVEIQASLAEGMLTHGFSATPAWTLGASLVITVLFGILAAFIFPRLTAKKLVIILIAFPALMIYFSNVIWMQTGIIISILIPVFVVVSLAIFNIAYGYLFETRRRDQLMTMFGQYVPEEHIGEMLSAKGTFALHGEDREMTVLFSDIQQFTTFSEQFTATELVDMMNEYLTAMTEVIYKYRGTIDKYVGDMIMAFWGAPLPDKNHADHAMRAALEMQSQLSKLRSSPALAKWSTMRMGVGINTGHMSVGDMGSRYRRNYTVIGDAVNLGSRVEGLTRFYDVDVIATESTVRAQPTFVYRKLDLVRVKGKHDAVAIYEVVGTDSSVSAEEKESLAKYHTALDYYFQQDWDKAIESFSALHHAEPHKKLYSIYLGRSKSFKENPPPAEWNGIFEHKEK